MKLLHISDLHIGKRLFGYSLQEEQAYMLQAIVRLAEGIKPDAVMLCGDIYDKTIPPEAAVQALDAFLTSLRGLGATVFVIAGNHDSGRRLGFANRLLRQSGLYIAGEYNGAPLSIELEDAFGCVNFTLLPYIRPAELQPCFDEPILTHSKAVELALSCVKPNCSIRNVLLAHQFVAAGEKSPWRSESETVGGLEAVDVSVLQGYEYVALGHLHGAQSVGAAHIRYAGAPMKYAFGESRDEKGLYYIELREKGTEPIIEFLPLRPLRDMLTIRGPMEELIKGTADKNAYIEAVVTDELETPDAVAKLRTVYPYFMHLKYDNKRSRATQGPMEFAPIEQKTDKDFFLEFYALQNGAAPDETGLALLEDALREEGP